jgi:hypothetical protein
LSKNATYPESLSTEKYAVSAQSDNVLFAQFAQSRNVLLTTSRLGRCQKATTDNASRIVGGDLAIRWQPSRRVHDSLIAPPFQRSQQTPHVPFSDSQFLGGLLLRDQFLLGLFQGHQAVPLHQSRCRRLALLHFERELESARADETLEEVASELQLDLLLAARQDAPLEDEQEKSDKLTANLNRMRLTRYPTPISLPAMYNVVRKGRQTCGLPDF